jgi:nitrogen-specific signal transduction histidine kinase
MTPNLISTAPQDAQRAPEGSGGDDRGMTAFLEQVPGALLLLDPDGRIEQLNSIAELRLDLVRPEAVGRDLFREVLPRLEAEGWGERYRSGMSTGRLSLACETCFPQPDGRGRVGLGLRSVMHRGRLTAIVLLEDRSALAEEEARRERAERLAAIGELASGVAHEINNPLASIKGFAQLLARDPRGESEMQALEIISRESSRIARVIDGLLAFADQQRTRGAEALRLTELVEQVLNLRQYPLETAGVEIIRELDPDISPVRAERSSLQRVVLAILAQAERSLDARESQRRLVVRTRESTDGVVLYVVDNGGGVPRDRLPTLLSPTVDEEAVGGGIDLGTAHAIVKDCGGHLSADSVEGQGTAFFLRLPRCEVAPVAVEGDAGLPVLHSLPERPLQVLVADDEATLRLALALFLGRHGHEVTQAADAYEALKLAREQRFDVVMIDARMPGDGLALLETLDADPLLVGRTVLMTGDHTHPVAAEAIRSGHAHLTKPFDMTDAIRLVESIGH